MKIPSLSQIWRNFVITGKRFPATVITALAGTILALISIQLEIEDNWVFRFLLTSSLAVFLFTNLTLFTEKTSKTWRNILMLIGFALMVGYYFSLPAEKSFSGNIFFVRHVFLILAGITALIWSPFLAEKIENETIWEWVRRLLMNLVETVFFGIIIFAGIAGAFFAVDALFELDLDYKIYLQVWTTVVGAFGPIYFLSKLPQNPANLTIPSPVPLFMKILTKYILTPLTVIYFLILYTYTFKVVISGDWPKNVLGWLVIGFSIIAVLTYFLWTPFWQTKIAKYRRLFWWVLIPQIAMLFVAIGWRIRAYSWTENRYFVVVFGLWLLGISLYFLVKKKATFRAIFVSLTTVILLTQIGPFSGYNIGKSAQKARLIKLLTENKILQNGTIVPTKIELPLETRYEISDKIDYLFYRHGRETVREIFPQIYEKLMQKDKNFYRWKNEITSELGFKFVSDWEMRKENRRTIDGDLDFSIHANHDSPRNIAGYDWQISDFYSFKSENSSEKYQLANRQINFKLDRDQDSLEIWENDKMLEKINFAKFLTTVVHENKNVYDKELTPEKLSYTHEGKNLNAKLFFRYISGEVNNVNNRQPESKVVFRHKNYDLSLYLRFKN